jgi:hypothetical protein
MANDDRDYAGRGQGEPGDEQADGADASGAADSVRDEQDQRRRGLDGRGFDAGTGYGGGGNASAYSGKSSYGGQAGYGGSTTHGAYTDGKFGRDQRHLHVEGDADRSVERNVDDIDPSAGERGRGAKGGLEE